MEQKAPKLHQSKKILHDFRFPPRFRRGSYASSTMGTAFSEPQNLGRHGYYFSLSEQNGIVYTCKAGHIDIAHLRKSADWTAYIAAKTYHKLMKNETNFSFKFKEASLFFVEIAYSEHWKYLPKDYKQKRAYEVALKLSQYFTYTAMTWHEILTWFGYKFTGTYSEFPSAFSWEDTISNLLGIHIAAVALQDMENSFDKAMTIAINKELQQLNVQPAHVAKKASDMVRGKWFSGDFLFFVEINGRNLDIGLEDGFVTPWLVPELSQCPGARPKAYPVPSLDFISSYGFTVKLEIEPREWEKEKIFNAAYQDKDIRKCRIVPEIHFSPIIEHIKKQAAEKYGLDLVPYSATN